MEGEQDTDCCLASPPLAGTEDTDDALDRLGDELADEDFIACIGEDLRSALTEAEELSPEVTEAGRSEAGRSKDPEKRWYMLVFFLPSVFLDSTKLRFFLALMAWRMRRWMF